MGEGGLIGWAIASLLVGLRIAPVFALAPPFTLTRVPALFRVLFALGIGGWMVSGNPAVATVTDFSAGALMVSAMRELLVGATVVLVFQLAFAALQLAGRTIDVQTGFGLAGVIDPGTQSQSPLVGSLFSLAAGAVFFALNGHHDLLRLFAASLELVPLGTATTPPSIAGLTTFVSVVFLVGLGVGGAAILGLFLADLAIALMSRTLPQMNVLVLGFQVKTLLLLLILPISLGFAGAQLARLIAMTLEAVPGLIG